MELKTKIIEHYFKWHIAYGIVGAITDIVILAPLNESVREMVHSIWKISHSLGWTVAIILLAVLAFGMLTAGHMIYTIFYEKLKRKVKKGYADSIDE